MLVCFCGCGNRHRLRSWPTNRHGVRHDRALGHCGYTSAANSHYAKSQTRTLRCTTRTQSPPTNRSSNKANSCVHVSSPAFTTPRPSVVKTSATYELGKGRPSRSRPTSEPSGVGRTPKQRGNHGGAGVGKPRTGYRCRGGFGQRRGPEPGGRTKGRPARRTAATSVLRQRMSARKNDSADRAAPHGSVGARHLRE